VGKKLIKNSQPIGKNVRKPQGGIFLTHTVDWLLTLSKITQISALNADTGTKCWALSRIIVDRTADNVDKPLTTNFRRETTSNLFLTTTVRIFDVKRALERWRVTNYSRQVFATANGTVAVKEVRTARWADTVTLMVNGAEHTRSLLYSLHIHS